MFFTERKLRARIDELSPYRYRDGIPISSFKSRMDVDGKVGAFPPEDGEWSTLQRGERWQGRDLYLWIQADVSVPVEWKEKTVVGLFDFGKTGGGHNSGFESLLFLNGNPFQGVDSNHQEVFIPSEASGSTLSLAFRLWSGLEGGGVQREQEHQIKRAELAWLDERVDRFYYDALVALETVEVLPQHAAERAQLLSALDRTFAWIDWSQPRSESFYRSIYAAGEGLEQELQTLEKQHGVTIRCIGHTHIDVAWLWRLKHTREKAARSFSTVLRLMERYPEYFFLQTQPQLYDYLKKDYPTIYEQIKERVKEGKWEVEGGMWLEADCNIPSGESLVRQLLLGTRFIREEFGKECRYLWLPDVFGYSWALPQILKKSGIDTFMTTKISWNQFNRMPHDTFWWKGMDGTEILTHFITTTERTDGSSWFYTYNGVITPASITASWEAYRDKEINQELLLSYGYGDGGGGVNREMLEKRRRVDRMPGLPQVTTGTAGEFFARLHDRINATDRYVHTWDGELYLEYHRGTYTSQAYNKKMNRRMELLYREAEWLNAIAGLSHLGRIRQGQDSLTEGWKIILRNQFHDIIPGSSIPEVYQDSREEYSEAEAIGHGVWNEAASSLLEKGADHYTVFHSAPWTGAGYVWVEGEEDTVNFTDSDGSLLTAQRSDGGWLVEVTDLPSMGFKSMQKQATAENTVQISPFTVKENSVLTPLYELEWDERGQWIRLYDREQRREVLAEGERGNVLQIFEDKPLHYDAWDIDLFYQQKMKEVVELQSIETVETGPLRVVIRFRWKYEDSSISQDVILYANSRRIDCQTDVDWQQRRQLLKVAFPVGIRATEATYDVQFGNVKRPTHWNTSWDYARFETVGHQWADLSERGYGVSLLNDCKYGYDIKGHVMRLTLLKSATFPDPEADRGVHSFTYALYPHAGDWFEGGTVQAAWALNSPPTVRKGRVEGGERSLFRISSPQLMVDAVKTAEDSNQLILRVHEYGGSHDEVTITSDYRLVSWQECDLMERPIGERQQGTAIDFSVKPYEIKTFLIELKRD
ncbi:alpha-mannosidase [Desmospora activa]|uniref:Alpha-mannosidase n=1 Tax=Desmospora activa DSM 45169 TaxID=1121389 RepID=A0A2T4Z7K1_9BACL|nr:alpha-mannosidase [Desmospora activa]PTM57867.1 alpha-mannosidase [Desmospora activa DSM 45169]